MQMFTSRAELLDKGETTAEHMTHRQEESGRLDKDKSNTDPQHGGLFRGLFKPKPAPLQPVVDLDDGVMRCPVCNWELADDEVCGGCGYEYHGESDGTDYTDEDSELSETENYDSIIDDEADDNDDGFGEIEDDDAVWGGYAVPGSYPPNLADLVAANPAAGISWHDEMPPFYDPGSEWPPRAWPPRPPRPRPSGVILTDPSEYDEHFDDEENEYDEADSFIDDDEEGHLNIENEDSQSEPSTVVEFGRRWRPGNSRRPIVIPGTSTTDEDEDEDEVRGEQDEEDGEDDEEDSVIERPSFRHLANFSSDEEEEESEMEEDGSSLMEPQRYSGVSDAHDLNAYYDALSSPTRTDESEGEESPEISRASGRRYLQGVIEDSEESESSDVSSPPPSRPNRAARTTGVSFGNAITIDDSEDEQPVGPVRRTAQRRHARFSPY